jgi:hypothetical protein
MNSKVEAQIRVLATQFAQAIIKAATDSAIIQDRLVNGPVARRTAAKTPKQNGYSALPYERRCEIARKAAATRKRNAQLKGSFSR